MAQLRRCSNGHYYDQSVYPSCPYCTSVNDGMERDARKNDAELTGMETMPLPSSYYTDSRFGKEKSVSQSYYGKEPYYGVTMPVSLTGENVEQRYVVGWLVAIKGPYKGKSFELHSGYTHVGRNEGDIVLPKDPKVSRSKQFSIIYSEKNNRYFLSAGSTTNLVYVNDVEVLSGQGQEIAAYCQIEAGDSIFCFIPLCGTQFQWKNYAD